MDQQQKDVVQELFSFLVYTVDPRYIMADIFRRRGMSRQLMNRIDEDPCRTHRAETFFLEIVDICPFRILIKSLKRTNHRFVAKKLRKAYQRITRQTCVKTTDQLFAWQSIHPVQNEECVYEELRSYKDNGKGDTLERRVSSIVWKWETEYKTRRPSPEKYRMAQAVIDAKLVWLRFSLEAEKPCDVLAQIHDVGSLIIHTTQPVKSTIMVLSVQLQLSVNSGGNIEDSLQKYNDIKFTAEKLELGAIHSVNVYVAEFLVDLMSYKLTGKQDLKHKLLGSIDQIMERFERAGNADEAEKRFRLQFIRRSLVVKALLCLNLTIGGRPIPGPVSSSDITSASEALEKVACDWEELDMRWKMLFHVALSRRFLSEGNTARALEEAENAQKLSNKLHHCEERRNVILLLEDIRNASND
ncbi:uncharacterized protein LOC132557881 [Ylistrum balloti]|uniref:uncharacterized protein LOC132557881 n=1 Tax=Ylistrum balloti TaxID=509963 RepID=UPI002905852C|nr:uncharacterized protein LOC132557881 [Ylistrum balloti]